MATRRSSNERGNDRPESVRPPRELIVIAEPAARMRSAGASVEAAAGTPVDELNRLLAEESATIHPVFGVNERRIEAARSARPGAAEALVHRPSSTPFGPRTGSWTTWPPSWRACQG